MTPEGERPARRLRRDAAADQERVLAAAVTAFVREGRQVPVAAIAAEAGVGVRTLYRRYPSREALLDTLALLVQVAEARPGSALQALDRWDRVIELRGQREGSVRDDVEVGDLVIFGAMLVAPLPGAADGDATARRQEVHLDGLAAPAARRG